MRRDNRFPTDRERKRKWIAALRREPDWEPIQSTLGYAVRFWRYKSNDKTSPEFILSLFSRVDHLAKRKAEDSLSRHERAAKRARQRGKEAEKENREKQRLTAADSSLVESVTAQPFEPLESLALTSECCSAPSDHGEATSSSLNNSRFDESL